MSTNLTQLPADLPRPLDDGQADHLIGIKFPSIELLSTDGTTLSTDTFNDGKYILYCYPMTGQPGIPLPDGWDMIPGARGCTPESLVFAEHHAEFVQAGFTVFGISTQDQTYQQEMAGRLKLPFSVLSDSEFVLTNTLKLPTLVVDGKTLIKRLTMIVVNGVITKVFYPAFPPDKHPTEVLYWVNHTNNS